MPSVQAITADNTQQNITPMNSRVFYRYPSATNEYYFINSQQK